MINYKSKKILIVDDNEMNRLILSDMLEDEFDLVQASGGLEAVNILSTRSQEISLMLLDVVMPDLDGFQVLQYMKEHNLADDIQVIMISAESAPSFMEKAYNLGAVDFISRPFDQSIVRRRITNTFMLYAKQQQLKEMVADQIKKREKNNHLMISILSHIVEFRNGESGQHVLHINTITGLLLKEILARTDKYSCTADDIATICTASSLHDIGKIEIPSEILNKPGRLTAEEFEIMKTHSAIGSRMMEQLDIYQDEPLVKYSYQICRWHHERWDGKGYPDGLKGDEIPLCAQIVSLADVYDALTSKRCYKDAYSHEQSVNMILNGECGCFNPVLLECFKEVQDKLKNLLDTHYTQAGNQLENEAMDIFKELNK